MSDLKLKYRKILTEFIHLYRQNECLWKIKSKDYSNRQKKRDAYNILKDKLSTIEPGATKEVVIKKINSLRTCFRKELKKYNASLESGADVYKPNLWYFDMFLFLTDQEAPRQDKRDSIEAIGNKGLNSESEEGLDIVIDPLDVNTAEYSDSNRSSTAASSRYSSKTTSGPTTRNLKRKKRYRSDKVLDVIANNLRPEVGTKYASYAKYVAQELEELPPRMAIYCKRIINEAIYHAQLGNLTESSRVVNEVEPAASNTPQPICPRSEINFHM